MTKRQVKRRKPLGKPLPEATDNDAEITQEDIERAKQFVAKYGSPKLKAMLDAKVGDVDDFNA